MKKKISLFISLLIVSILAIGSHNWQRVNYRNSTIISGVIWKSDKPAKDGDVVGAFVNNECRMIATVFTKNDTAYISSVIHGEVSENIEFRLWDKENDKIMDAKETLKSNPGGSVFLYPIKF